MQGRFYEFTTYWHFRAPITQVWDAIYHSESWPQWWKGLESVVELEKGHGSGIGNVRRYTWKGLVPYRLTFDIRTTRIEPLTLLQGTAAGDLIGTGTWHFGGSDGTTLVRYEWRVQTAKPWMNLLAPVAQPLFRWNHDKVMAWGEAGLSRLLQTAATEVSFHGLAVH